MPGVSSRAPVAGEHGVGKIHFKFKPRKTRKISLIALFVYLCFGSVMFFIYAWPKPNLRYNVIVPILRLVCSGFDFIVHYNFGGNSLHIPTDSSGTPYLVGSDLPRVVFHQGYVHAADRLSQMDLLRRSATGRLSELYGNRTFEMDKLSLALNLHNLASLDLEALRNEEYTLLQAYSNGVNEYIDQSSSSTIAGYWSLIPVEYLRWVGFSNSYRHTTYDRWEPVHTLSVMRLLAYQWGSGWEQQLLNIILDVDVGTESEPALSSFLPSLGGNSFVISGKHTKSGSAILAGDFQSQLTSEGLWYKNSLETPTMHVSGVSIPGLPLVVMGRNEHISWSFTSLPGAEEELLHIDGEDSDAVLSTIRQEVIKITNNGSESLVEVDIQQTQLRLCNRTLPSVGDLVSPRVRAYLNSHHPETLSLRLLSPALQHCMDLQFFLRLNTAKTSQDFLYACASLKVMSLNVMYADTHGDIFNVVNTHAPCEVDSTYIAPFGSLKKEFNPPEGYFVSSSGPVVKGQSRLQYLLGEHLKDGGLISVEEAQRMLLDEYSPSSLTLVDILRSINTDSSKYTSMADEVKVSVNLARNLVESFDGIYSVSSTTPTLLEAFRSALIHNIARSSGHPLAYQLMEGGGRLTTLRRPQLAKPGSYWVLEYLLDSSIASTSPTVSRLVKMLRLPSDLESLIVISLHDAVSWCITHYGEKPEKWLWGQVHAAVYLHPSVPNFYLSDVSWSRGPHPMGGGVDSLLNSQYVVDNALFDRTALHHTNSIGTSLRYVMDMSSDSSVHVNTPIGQANNIGSLHYRMDSFDQFIAVQPEHSGVSKVQQKNSEL